MGMHVHLDNPDLQAKIERWTSETGRPAKELVQDVMTNYFDEIAQVQTTLDSRYDEIKSGRVKLIPGAQIEAHFTSKKAASRLRRS